MSGPAPSNWWRLWAVEASWNREGMQSLGLVVAMLPWLRRQERSAPQRAEWLRTHLAFANTNPYLAGLLIGAMLRHEEREGPEPARRLGEGLSRNLGSLGDSFFWGAARPATALLAVTGGLLWGVSAVLGLWLLFAGLQAWLRVRTLRMGYAAGVDVVELVAQPRIHEIIAFARGGLLAVVGLVSVIALGTVLRDGPGEDSVLRAAALLAVAAGGIASWRHWAPGGVLGVLVLVSWLLARSWAVLGLGG